MTSGQDLRKVNAAVNIVAGVFGISVNSLLIFLLLSTRIPELKNCNRLILQIAMMDIIDSIVMIIIMPIGIVIEGRELFFHNGFLQSIQHQTVNHLIVLIWQFFHFFSLSVVPVQFVYRYLVLCKNKTITNKVFASLFLVPFSISFLQIINAHFTTYPNLNNKNEILQELFQYFNTKNINEIIIGTGGEHSTSDTIIFNLSSAIVLTISYMVTFYCGYKIRAYFKASSDCFTPKTAQMHQSLNRILFFQALTPIIFLILPTSLFLLISLSKQTTPPAFGIFLTATSWPPFVNATFALITLKPLRRKFIGYFIKITQNFKSITETSNTNAPQILNSNLHPLPVLPRRHSCIGPN